MKKTLAKASAFFNEINPFGFVKCASFIEAISCYFAWICNILDEDFEPDDNEVEEVLQAYLESRGN